MKHGSASGYIVQSTTILPFVTVSWTTPCRDLLQQIETVRSECRTQFSPSDELLMELQLPLNTARKYKFYYGKGCARCNNSGYKGRVGIYELLTMSDEIRDAIAAEASGDDIRDIARQQGMTTLREAGLKLIFDGLTTIDEVVRETVMEDIE